MNKAHIGISTRLLQLAGSRNIPFSKYGNRWVPAPWSCLMNSGRGTWLNGNWHTNQMVIALVSLKDIYNEHE